MAQNIIVSDSFKNEKRGRRRDLRSFHVEAATSSVETAGNAYQSPSLISIGAQAQDVAVSTSVTNLVLSLLLLKVLPFIHARSYTKKTILLVALAGAVGWLPLIFVFMLHIQVTSYFILFLWVINIVPSMLVLPFRDNWMSEILPSGRMGRYLSLRSAISATFFLGAFYVMGHLLDVYNGRISAGYAIAFTAAFVASFISFIIYSAIRTPVNTTAEDGSNFGLTNFLEEAGRGHLGRFILYISLFTFSVSLASPLFAVYMLNDLHFSYLTYTQMVSAEYLTRIISLSFWGKYMDRAGSLKVLRIVSYVIPIIPILWLFSSGFVYLMVIQAFSGILWAAFDLGNQTYIFQAAPEEKRFRYILYHRSLSTFSIALGAIAGGYLLKFVPPVLGNSILGVFLVSGLLRFMVVSCMLSGLKEADDIRQRRSAVSSVTPILRVPVAGGLFYNPKLWARYYTSGSDGETNDDNVSVEHARIGLLYKPERWKRYHPKLETETVKADEDVVLSTDGLYYRTEQGDKYHSQSDNKLEKPDVSAVPTTDGLYYRAELLNKYHSQLETKAVKPADNVVIATDGLYYKSEQWSKYYSQSENKVEKSDVSVVPAKDGLYYRAGQWKKYHQQSEAKAAQPANDVVPAMDGLFHKPQLWSKYFKPASNTKITLHRRIAFGSATA